MSRRKSTTSPFALACFFAVLLWSRFVCMYERERERKRKKEGGKKRVVVLSRTLSSTCHEHFHLHVTNTKEGGKKRVVVLLFFPSSFILFLALSLSYVQTVDDSVRDM